MSDTTPLALNQAPIKHRGRPRLVVAAVVGAFVLPIVLAWGTVFGFLPDWLSGRLNHGTLLPEGSSLPLADATAAPLERVFGQWSVLVMTTPDCIAPCRLDDAMLHRFAQAIAVDGERVSIYRAGTHAQTPAGVNALPMSESERQAVAALVSGTTLDALIVDYQRRPVLAYPAPAEPAAILRDLRRLLRASRAP